MIVGIGLSPRGGSSRGNEPFEVVIGKGLIAIDGVSECFNVPPGIKAIPYILKGERALDRFQSFQAVVVGIVGIVCSDPIAQGEPTGLALRVEAAIGGIRRAPFFDGRQLWAIVAVVQNTVVGIGQVEHTPQSVIRGLSRIGGAIHLFIRPDNLSHIVVIERRGSGGILDVT